MSNTIEESGITIACPRYGTRFVPANPTQQLVYNRLVERHGEPLNLYKGFGMEQLLIMDLLVIK